MSDNKRNREFSPWSQYLTDEVDPQDALRDFFGTIAKLPGMPRSYGAGFVWNF